MDAYTSTHQKTPAPGAADSLSLRTGGEADHGLSFAPPDKGSWDLNQVHFPRPASIYMMEAFPGPMQRGFADATRHYGALLDYVEIGFANRFMYTCARPVGAPKGMRGMPPRWLFRLLLRLHPEMRRRLATAEQVFIEKRWRQDAAWWEKTLKPASIARWQTLKRVAPHTLSRRLLIEHLDACRAYLDHSIWQHHRLTAATIVPLGDFLGHAALWSGTEPGAFLIFLQGASPVSAGAGDELAALADALGDTETPPALDSDPGQCLEALAARNDAIGTAARTYLETVGLRMIGGYDVADTTAAEKPDLLLRMIREAVAARHKERTGAGGAAATAAARKRLLERIPEQHRTAFTSLLEEARRTYGLRDDRIFYGDAWATGLMRRALLAAGAKLVAEGRLEAADHALDMTHQEILAHLRDEVKTVTAAEIEARARFRHHHQQTQAPTHLGAPAAPPPPSHWLPPAAARVNDAYGVVLTLMFGSGGVQKDPQVLRGLAASAGLYEGTARVVTAPEDMARLAQGDVLVSLTTAPSYNVVLPLLGGIVTERGGLLCHTAIVAREYGLPGIVGCEGATTLIPDGARVRLNGETGEVWILT